MNRLERIIVYSSLLVFFILAAIFDLQITQGIYAPNNGFGKTFEILGSLPSYVLGVFAAMLIAFFRPKKNVVAARVVFWIFLVLGAGIAFYGGYHGVDLINRVTGWGLSGAGKWFLVLGLAAVLFGLGLLPIHFIQKIGNVEQAFLFGIFLAVIMACTVGWMQIVKMIWLRPRFRTLMALQEAGAITNAADWWLPFFHPQFFTSFDKYKAGGAYGFTQAQIDKAVSILGTNKWGMEEFYSFPSGHTMNTFPFICLCYLPNLLPKLKSQKHFGLIVRLCVYGFTLIVGLSRMVRGAHNATDILAGFFFAFLIFDLGSTFLYKRFLLGAPAKE